MLFCRHSIFLPALGIVLQSGNSSAGEVHFLDAEIQHPATVSEIAGAVGTSKDLAGQVYAAAHLLAATAPEKAFIENLAKALALDSGLVAHIDATPPWRHPRTDLETGRGWKELTTASRLIAVPILQQRVQFAVESFFEACARTP